MNKNNSLFWIILVLCSQSLSAGIDFSETEKELRRELYTTYNCNPYFYKNDRCDYVQDADYWITILEIHSKLLKQKIAKRHSCLRSQAFKDTLVYSCPLIASLLLIGLFTYTNNDLFLFGSIIPLPVYLMVSNRINRLYKVIKYIINGSYIKEQQNRLQRDKQLIAIFKTVTNKCN